MVRIIFVLKLFQKRIGLEGNEVCAYYSTALHWVVDPFHIRGHVVSNKYSE